jgi:hypothetical protein
MGAMEEETTAAEARESRARFPNRPRRLCTTCRVASADNI